MFYLKRALHLYLHYFSGPLFGFNQKLIVADNQPLPLFPAVAYTVLLAALLFRGWSRSSWLALALLLAPIFLYAVSPVLQLLLEYRAYLSSAGITLLLASLFHDHPSALLPILLFFVFQTHRRHRLYSSPTAFWTQAARDCPSPAVLANLALAIRNPGLVAEFGMTLNEDGTLDHLEVVDLHQRALDSGAIVVTEEMLENGNGNGRGDTCKEG